MLHYSVGYAQPVDPVKKLTATLLNTVRGIKEGGRGVYLSTLDDQRPPQRDSTSAFEAAKEQVPVVLGASGDAGRLERETDYLLRLVAFIVAENPALAASVTPLAAAVAKAAINVVHPAAGAASLDSAVWSLLTQVAHEIKVIPSSNTCSACGKPLGDGRHTLFDSRIFHVSCFACSRCRTPLASEFAMTGGQPTCKRCLGQ